MNIPIPVPAMMQAADAAAIGSGLDIKLWVLCGLVAVIIPMLGYFFHQERQRRDLADEKLEKNFAELGKQMNQLTKDFKDVQIWVQREFVSRETYSHLTAEMRAIRAQISDLERK